MQTMSLMQSYDVRWPTPTHQALNWADIASAGVSVAAPECRVGAKYNFYYMYVMQMSLPVRPLWKHSCWPSHVAV